MIMNLINKLADRSIHFLFKIFIFLCLPCFGYPELAEAKYASSHQEQILVAKRIKKFKKRSKRKSRPKSKFLQTDRKYQFAAGVGLTSIYTPTLGASVTIRGFDHYGLALDFGSGDFDTGSFVDSKNAANVEHSFFSLGLHYYPSFEDAFYFGATISQQAFIVESEANYTFTDLELGEIKEFDIPQTTKISSLYLTPNIGFYNTLARVMYFDLRLGVSIPLSSSVEGEEDLSGLENEDQPFIKEAVEGEREDVIKLLGGMLPHLSLTFGYHTEF